MHHKPNPLFRVDVWGGLMNKDRRIISRVRSGSNLQNPPIVRTGSEELNHPEHMWKYPIVLCPSVAQGFGRFEPPRTHVKLHCRPGSLCCTMVRTGSTLPNLFAGLVRCVALWFEQVWNSWTTPNSCEMILWQLPYSPCSVQLTQHNTTTQHNNSS